MTVVEIRQRLTELGDDKNAAFQFKLTPGIERQAFLGVRMPDIRRLAKDIAHEGGAEEFLSALPHEFYDEYALHAVLLCGVRDYAAALEAVTEFLPYIDNWAVCDTLKPAAFSRHKPELLNEIRNWCESGEAYTVRFGIEMLMTHFLDADFKAEYLEIPAAVQSSEYYVNMMTAWFFATALAKQWDEAVKYIENRRLSPWTHSKAIQKALESFRVTDEHKKYLRTLREG